jgi:hypothetical protein
MTNKETQFKKGHKHSKETIEKIRNSLKGRRVSKKTEFKKGKNRENKNNRWVKENPSYATIHKWVLFRNGKAEMCLLCGSMKNVDWANIDHKYRRNLSDFISLCRSCHRKFDFKFNKGGWKNEGNSRCEGECCKRR